MRLIDADAMNEELFYKQVGGKDSLITAESAFKMIDAQPTAYDVEAVVERLQEITDDDAIAEGSNWKNGKNVGFEEKMRRTAVERFSEIWDSTIKKSDLDRYGWQANPYVFAIEFVKIDKQEVV